MRGWMWGVMVVAACSQDPDEGADETVDTLVDTPTDTPVDAPAADSGDQPDTVDTPADDTPPDDTPTADDLDGDGLWNADDPNPQGSDRNLLNSTSSGGAAEVVFQTGYTPDGVEDELILYDAILTNFGCELYWAPQTVLCDVAPGTDDPDRSVRAGLNSGITFRNASATATGVFVVDACADGSCDAIDPRSGSAFQMMFSDGKTTAIQVAVHPELGATPPAWDDAGWVIVTDGTDGFEPVADSVLDASNLEVTSPTRLVFPAAARTRYVRVGVRNDATLGLGNYVELRQLKLYGAPTPRR